MLDNTNALTQPTGWEDLTVKDCQVAVEAPLSAGKHTFRILGANLSKFDEGAIEVALAVDENSDDAGKRAYVKYPDPAKVNPKTGKSLSWSKAAFGKLAFNIGIDPLDGERHIEYINRVAQNGAARVQFAVTHRQYTAKDGTERTAIDVSPFSVAPAA